MDIHHTDPIWTVQHLAAVFHLDLQAACAMARVPGFPLPRVGFTSDLWTRSEVLTWFSAQPGRILDELTPPASAPTALTAAPVAPAGHRSYRPKAAR